MNRPYRTVMCQGSTGPCAAFGHGMPCVNKGEVIAGDRLGNVDWFVNGLIGQPM